MSDAPVKLEFLSEEEYALLLKQAQQQLAMDEDFRRISSLDAVPKEYSRKYVVEAFGRAFQLIGGVPRMALWANQNPGEFFKLFARLLPSQASSVLGESNELVVRHIIGKSPLDD